VITGEGRGTRVVVAVSVLIVLVALGGIAAIAAGDRSLGRPLIGLAVVTSWLPILLRKRFDLG
jgi:hypothetical protein